MTKSESIKALAEAMAKAQASIKGALKDSDNPFFKSKYADLASVVEAIREPLAKEGLAYVQVSHDHESAATIETVILHSSGEWLSCGPVSVPVTKADAQGFGSAMTYARRYSLSAAFGVAPEDDDGNAAAKAAPRKESPGQIVDQHIAIEGLTAEVVAGLRAEAKKIEGDFYVISAKAAMGSWNAFKKDASLEEQTACWSMMDSKVRSGIKKVGQLEAA
jgi:hypothetical protein